MFFNIGGVDLPISKLVRIQGKAIARVLYLRGVGYSDGKHYPARAIDCDEVVWFKLYRQYVVKWMSYVRQQFC